MPINWILGHKPQYMKHHKLPRRLEMKKIPFNRLKGMTI